MKSHPPERLGGYVKKSPPRVSGYMVKSQLVKKWLYGEKSPPGDRDYMVKSHLSPEIGAIC